MLDNTLIETAKTLEPTIDTEIFLLNLINAINNNIDQIKNDKTAQLELQSLLKDFNGN